MEFCRPTVLVMTPLGFMTFEALSEVFKGPLAAGYHHGHG